MKTILSFIIILLFYNCNKGQSEKSKHIESNSNEQSQIIIKPKGFGEKLSNAALTILDPGVIYTPTYTKIPYPNGDVPAKTGVCTDVVIRAYRKLNLDLQKEVHTDMSAHFSEYPKIWGLTKPDTNIDHRRVPNLEKFFERKGKKLPLSKDPKDFLPGDIVTWKVNGKLPHIGIVTHLKNEDGIPLLVHNIGGGQVLEDCLFSYDMVGKFRYDPN